MKSPTKESISRNSTIDPNVMGVYQKEDEIRF